MSLSPINPPPLINTSGRMISREVKLAPDSSVTVFNVDIDDDTAWTLGYQADETGDGSATVLYRRNLVSLEQTVTFGKYGGDFLTGIGSFSFIIKSGAAAGGCNVKAFWTLQPRLIDVGSLISQTTVASGAAYSNLGAFEGFIPFPYNVVSIFSAAPQYDFRIEDEGGNVLSSPTTINPTSAYVTDFRPPPNGRIRVSQASGSNQLFTAVYSRI